MTDLTTRGPWISDQYGRIYGAPDDRSKHSNGRTFLAQVVDVAGKHSPHLDNGVIDGEGMANARVMAAAWKLLRAAKMALPHIQIDYDSARSDPFGSFDDINALRALEEAIADAEGGVGNG